LSAGGGASSAPALVASERLNPVGGDLTGDGLPDLIDAPGITAVSVLADGRYVETPLLSGGNGAVWRQPGDLDGDGQPELLVVADGQLVLLRGAAPFVAQAAPEVAWSWSTSGNTLAPVGDVNADGFDDLAAFTFRAGADPGAGRLDLLPGGPAGPATVASFTLLGVTGADVRPSGRYGNLTGDGVDDLLVGFGGLDPSATIALHPGSPAGPAPTPTWTVSGTTPDLPGRAVVAPGDVDGDGLNDLVYTVSDLAYGTPGAVVLAHGRPGGLEPTPTTTLAVTLPAELSAAGDVDGDGLADVLLVGGAYGRGPTGAEIEVLLGDPGGWGRSLPLASSRNVGGAPAGDLDGDVNGDGFSDLLLTASGTATLWFGSPRGPLPVSCAGQPDLDADGACDLTDPDDDGDLVLDALDAAPLDASACGVDLDADGCDDCPSGRLDVLTDGPDLDGDGLCDAGDLTPAVCPVGLT
jgi:hypothetical protein